MNVRYRVELSQAERRRTHGAPERRQACGSAPEDRGVCVVTLRLNDLP